jgi:hypothetical protein
MAGITRRPGEFWRLITLTMPTVPADRLSLISSIALVLDALERFQERLWWNETARATVKNLEFTLGDLKRLAEESREWESALDGYHTHAHLLVLSKWIDYRRLRTEWSESLVTAMQKAGVADLTPDGRFDTPSGHAIVDVRLVVNRKVKGKKHVISIEGAIQEATKYITKNCSFDSIPGAQLVEVAEVKRWPRCFELTGEARGARQTAAQKREACRRAENDARMREWIGSDPRRPRPDLASGERDWRERPAFGLLASVHTHGLSPDEEKKKRPPPWRAEGGRERAPSLWLLLESLPFDEWLKVLDRRVANVRRYRRAALSRQYPCGTFETLAGETFGLNEEEVRYAA